VTIGLVVSYFNWIWKHSRFQTTAAQRANLTTESWTWNDLATYFTIILMHNLYTIALLCRSWDSGLYV
jgi:hypothetical protein